MTVDGAIVGAIQHGLLVLIGVTHSDSEAEARAIGDKLAGLRIFGSLVAADDDHRNDALVVEGDAGSPRSRRPSPRRVRQSGDGVSGAGDRQSHWAGDAARRC